MMDERSEGSRQTSSDERSSPLLQGIQRVEAFTRRRLKWLTRVPIVLLFLLGFFNPLGLHVVDKISEPLGFAEPSLITLIGVALLFVVLERIVIVEDKVSKGPLATYETKVEAYTVLSEQLSSQKQKVREMDLLQFSGDTARELLRMVSRHSPKAKVRMLLFDPNSAGQFDSNWRDWHARRILGTIAKIEEYKEDSGEDGFMVDIRYYTANPSVSAVIIDNNRVSVSWYRYFMDGDVMRLRGHSSAAITGTGDPAVPLRSFAQRQFDELWKIGKEARSQVL